MAETLTTFVYVEPEDGPAEVNFVSGPVDGPLLERLARSLGRMRQGMRPIVPVDPPGDRPELEVVTVTNWRAFRLGDTRELALQIRHPGFGWLTFRVSAAAREYLLDSLEDV